MKIAGGNKSFLKKISILLILLLSVAVFTACGEDQLSLKERGLTIQITYDFNGGKVNAYYQKNVYVKKDAPIVKPSKNVHLKEPTFANHYLKAWYFAKTDENGEILRNEDGRAIPSENEVDFSTFKAENDTTVVAVWTPENSVTVAFGEDSSGNLINPIKKYYGDKKRVIQADLPGIEVENKTVVDFWYDAALTQKVEFPLEFPERGVEVALTLFPSFIEGKWTLIRTQNDFLAIASFSGKSFYIMNDIDMTDTSMEPIVSFTGKIAGNGFTVSNLTVKKTDTKTGDKFGFISTMQEDSEISGIVFENSTVEIVATFTNGPTNVGFLAGVVRGTVKNCTFTNCVLKLKEGKEGINFVYNAGTSVEGVYGTKTATGSVIGITGNPAIEFA